MTLLFCLDNICPILDGWLQRERGLLGLERLNKQMAAQAHSTASYFKIFKSHGSHKATEPKRLHSVHQHIWHMTHSIAIYIVKWLRWDMATSNITTLKLLTKPKGKIPPEVHHRWTVRPPGKRSTRATGLSRPVFSVKYRSPMSTSIWCLPKMKGYLTVQKVGSIEEQSADGLKSSIDWQKKTAGLKDPSHWQLKYKSRHLIPCHHQKQGSAAW